MCHVSSQMANYRDSSTYKQVLNNNKQDTYETNSYKTKNSILK